MNIDVIAARTINVPEDCHHVGRDGTRYDRGVAILVSIDDSLPEWRYWSGVLTEHTARIEAREATGRGGQVHQILSRWVTALGLDPAVGPGHDDARILSGAGLPSPSYCLRERDRKRQYHANRRNLKAAFAELASVVTS
jgi:hypothetical protein